MDGIAKTGYAKAMIEPSAAPTPTTDTPPASATPPPASGLPAPTGHPLRRLYHHLLVAPWDRIDARDKGQPQVGRVSARAAAIWTAIVAALMLTTLRFVVMDHEVQQRLARAAVDGAVMVSPRLGEWLRPHQGLLVNLSWVSGCFTCYFAIPAVVLSQVFGLRLREAYLAPRDYLRHLPLYGLLFLPVGLSVLVVAQNPEFQNHYPFYTSPHHGADQLVWELGYAVQFFALEFFFRGFMLRGLSAEMGSSAVLAMMIPYCMIHFGKPLPECIGSILAGTVLGLLAMDTRSIWGGATIHIAVAWSMDAAALAQKGWFSP